MVVGKRWILKHHFDGMPKLSDFKLIEENLPSLIDGELLVDALYSSVDPYQKPFSRMFNPPVTMIGIGVYKVRESKDQDYPVGSILVANIGWVKTGK